MIVKKGIGINVVEAARKRIIDAFALGRTVELGFSGGKDSIVLAHIVYELAVAGKIDVSRLTVVFIDEEAMFEDVIKIVKQWRQRFMEIGAKFIWYCLQVKHFDCLNSMSEEETFICWDQAKKDVWVREMPQYAVTDDEFLIPYKDNYQSFLQRKCNAYGTVSMRGVRVSESMQRLKYISKMKTQMISLPIYDMTDKDVWLYILKYNLEYPAVYENLYRIGRSKKDLRISQFFSIDTAKVLVNLGEMYPDLMQRVERREPNAYLCALYWDTEMFGRSSAKRRELENSDERKDYKALVHDYLRHPEAYQHPELARAFRNIIIRSTGLMIENDWKKIYECVIKGDPKRRTVRAISNDISARRKDK